MKKVVVTGATSFIGVHLINQLIEAGYYVYAVARPASVNMYRIPSSDKVKILELELCQIEKIIELIPSADVFYHLAWEGTRAPYRDDKKLQEKNYQCSVAAMRSAIALGVDLFVGSGSQAEYGKMTGEISEKYPCRPITAYGIEKYHASQTLAEMAEKAQIRFCWMRIFSLYGDLDYSSTLVMSCIDKMKKNLPIQLTECTQNWDYTFIGDAVEAMVLFIDKSNNSGVYNIASGASRPLREYVEEIKEVLHSDSLVEYGAVPYGPEGPVSMKPVVNKMKNELNWTPKTSFRHGIEMICEL